MQIVQQGLLRPWTPILSQGGGGNYHEPCPPLPAQGFIQTRENEKGQGRKPLPYSFRCVACTTAVSV